MSNFFGIYKGVTRTPSWSSFDFEATQADRGLMASADKVKVDSVIAANNDLQDASNNQLIDWSRDHAAVDSGASAVFPKALGKIYVQTAPPAGVFGEPGDFWLVI